MARKYTLKKGQTLQFVAKNHGITLSELLSANPGLNSASAGISLNIPQPPKPPSPTKKISPISNRIYIPSRQQTLAQYTQRPPLDLQMLKLEGMSNNKMLWQSISLEAAQSLGLVDKVSGMPITQDFAQAYTYNPNTGMFALNVDASGQYGGDAEGPWSIRVMKAQAASGQKWAETALSEQPWTNPIYKNNLTSDQWYKAVESGTTFGNRIRGIGISAPGMIGTQTMDMPNKIRQWGQRIAKRRQPDENPDTSGTQSIYPYGFGGLVTWRI